MPGPGSSRTIYTVIRSRTATVWSTTASGGTGAFETFTSGNWADYGISCVEQGVNNFYVGNFPSAIPAGVYELSAHQQMGGSAAQTDPRVAMGQEQWTGTALFPLSDLATSGQLGQLGPIRLAQGVAVSGFPIYLKSAADHVTPFTSGTISGQISKDGGSFGAFQSGTISETGLGFYRLNLTSGDLNAVTVAMLFTGAGISGGACDPLPLAAVLQKVSGSV